MLDRVTIERMARRAGEGPILIALSGGGDSVALLHLMVEQFGAAHLRAAIVDHALRDGSANDAARAVAFAADAGVSAEVLQLRWDANANRAHQAAREARYGALCAAARLNSARVIATGHTRDDQAETVFLRAARGSGWRGLAGMRALAPAPLWPEGRDLWLARPLLSARRDGLRAYLQQRGAAWIEDPANANPNYARVRARKTLSKLQRADLDPMRFAALAERLAPRAAALDAAAAEIIAAAVSFDADAIRINRPAWLAPDVVRQRALSVLLTAAGGHARGPSDEQAQTMLIALDDPAFEAATLAGAELRRCADAIVMTRDRGALTGRADGAAPLPPLPLAAGAETIWDRRVALTAMEPGWSVIIENAAPVLAHGAARHALSAANPVWLLAARVNHLLNRD